ncbi:MAG: biopolymer transporter ExbD [Verrucomicrobiales bacterium]|nr:biopolymer transporter ExbD [Verrucomicrobiales bacterium]
MRNSKHALFRKSLLSADLSPMIDLVFLLLIFFMVSSKLVTIRQDPRVTVPDASSAIIPDATKDRLVLNILPNGDIAGESGKLIDLESVTDLISARKASTPNLQLHLRTDRGTLHENVKKVIDAASKAGVNKVHFATRN